MWSVESLFMSINILNMYFTCKAIVFSVFGFLYIMAHGDGGTKIKKKPHMTPIRVPIDTMMNTWRILMAIVPSVAEINANNIVLNLII